jgi:hypothetical protein
MDPFLEHPELWPDVHHGLIEALRESLAPRLRPKYRVAIEKRTYLAEPEGLVLVGRPDVSVVEAQRRGSTLRPTGIDVASSVQPMTVPVPLPEVMGEARLEVRDVATSEVITAVEILSPANKRPGEGRRVYEVKRQRILASLTHLVEIDLLRGGECMPVMDKPNHLAYGILVSRSEERPRAKLHAFRVREGIPSFPLPLRSGEAEPLVDVQSLLSALYDRAGYDLALDYRAEPLPPLADEDGTWADALLRTKGLR